MMKQGSGGHRVRRSLPAIAAAAVVVVVVAVGSVGSADRNSSSSSGSNARTTSGASVAPSVGPATTAVPTPQTAVPVLQDEYVPLERTLADGVTGSDVRRLQQRLIELGFAPGDADGIYGPLTIQSVWAYEKIVMGVRRESVSGRVSPEMWSSMNDKAAVTPRRPQPAGANHTEIYLPEQVMAVFHAGRAVFVAHISHGTGDEWCEEVTISPGEYGNEHGTAPVDVGRCGIASTPGGVFTYHREVAGNRQSALGGMLNPVYFNYGLAVHGASNVPNEAASHGCVRIPNAVSAQYQELVSVGERVFVWDGVEEPEAYGEQLPTFDWEWEEYSATTTTTTTTTPTPTTTTTTSLLPTIESEQATTTTTTVSAPLTSPGEPTGASGQSTIHRVPST